MKRIAVLAALALVIPTSGAFAVSEVVKRACSADYAAYCSKLKIGSPELHACMHAHRKMLTSDCIHALGHSDEVSAAEIREYKAERGR